MKAQELRIGNYLQGEPISLVNLQMYGDGTFIITGEGISLIEQGILKNLKPILLTEEWLLKLGFEKEVNNAWFKKQLPKTKYSPDISELSYCDGIIVWHQYLEEGMTIERAADIKKSTKIKNIKDSAFILKNSKIVLEIKMKYVHQFQNLYFALTGEELTLKEE